MGIKSVVPIEIQGVKVDDINQQEIHQRILDVVSNHSKIIIGNVNIHALNLAYTTPWFRDFLNDCEICFCDGYGVKAGAWLLGKRLQQRITYADWIWELSGFCMENKISLFLLGACPGVAERAAKKLKECYPDLSITGTHHGYFEMNPENMENKGVIGMINQSKPDILLLGMGMPLQEKWLDENWDRLDVRIGLTGGAVFDYVSGELKRAPKWMTDHGFEWLGRLIIEPRRLWKRYLIGNPLFFWRIFKHHFLGLPLPHHLEEITNTN